MSKLDGKVAVVTGASKGIGAAIAEDLAAAGASVIVNYSTSKTGADAVVEKIKARGGKAVAVQGNVSKLEDIARLFQETVAAFGKVDILVNNAGIYDFKPLEAITPEHFHSQFDLNVLGLLLTTQEAVKHMGPEGGSILNIGSIVGPMPASHGRGLQRHQGRCGRDYGLAVQGAWAEEDSSELLESRHGRHRGRP